jgi:hypothetical protein
VSGNKDTVAVSLRLPSYISKVAFQPKHLRKLELPSNDLVHNTISSCLQIKHRVWLLVYLQGERLQLPLPSWYAFRIITHTPSRQPLSRRVASSTRLPKGWP